MDWLRGNFEGTTHEVSRRQYNWDSHREIEDVDRAIAISLTEEEKRKHAINDDSQLKEDENLARALKESLKLKPSPWKRIVNRIGNVFHPTTFSYASGNRICAGRKLSIRGRFLNSMGAICIPKCFKCHVCNQPTFEYMMHPFWAQNYCPLHDHDGTPRCSSCRRLESRETRYFALKDGRKLCLECLDSAVMDTTECQPLYLDIQRFYESLDMKVEQNIPLLLVERQVLNEDMDGEQNGHYHGVETRGRCRYKEKSLSIPTVLRKLRFVDHWLLNIILEPYKVLRRSEVTEILILYGLPRLLTGKILAHEMMHAWLRLNGYRNLCKYVGEGICEVLAHMWLISQIESTSGQATSSRQWIRSPFEKKLSEFFKHQIEYNTSEVYGDGFRAANQAVLKHGLHKTLHHIRLTGSFPS